MYIGNLIAKFPKKLVDIKYIKPNNILKDIIFNIISKASFLRVSMKYFISPYIPKNNV